MEALSIRKSISFLHTLLYTLLHYLSVAGCIHIIDSYLDASCRERIVVMLFYFFFLTTKTICSEIKWEKRLRFTEWGIRWGRLESRHFVGFSLLPFFPFSMSIDNTTFPFPCWRGLGYVDCNFYIGLNSPHQKNPNWAYWIQR